MRIGEFPVRLTSPAIHVILSHMTKDRKAYFREYQRQRYARLRVAIASKETEEQRLSYKEECQKRELSGQKNWRARQKLRAELGLLDRKADSYVRAFLFRRAKIRATTANIAFEIEPSDIPLPTHCAVLGIKLDYLGLSDSTSKYKPSIDRINNTKGYTKDNIQVISHRANVLKRDATPKELMALGAWAAQL